MILALPTWILRSKDMHIHNHDLHHPRQPDLWLSHTLDHLTQKGSSRANTDRHSKGRGVFFNWSLTSVVLGTSDNQWLYHQSAIFYCHRANCMQWSLHAPLCTDDLTIPSPLQLPLQLDEQAAILIADCFNSCHWVSHKALWVEICFSLIADYPKSSWSVTFQVR